MSKSNPKRQRADMPVFHTMGMAVAALGVPESLVKLAKRKGCKAFLVSGRVDSGILLPFIFKMLADGNGVGKLPEGFSSWREVLESEKAQREAIKRKQDEGLTMLVADAEVQAGEAGGFCLSSLERLARELPPALAGLSAVEIFKRLNSEVESIRKQLEKKFQEIGK